MKARSVCTWVPASLGHLDVPVHLDPGSTISQSPARRPDQGTEPRTFFPARPSPEPKCGPARGHKVKHRQAQQAAL
jgi:hypothetical protein